MHSVVDLEMALILDSDKERSQESSMVSQSAESGLNNCAIKQGPAPRHPQFTCQGKLPKLALKKFHGNPIDWYPFWKSFESAVHRDSALTGVDNIQLTPEGEVNSGGYIPRREASRYISTALHRP